MPVYTELSKNAVVVSPGTEEVERLVVRNLGDSTESFAIVALGMSAAWTLIDPPTLTLFAGEEQSVRVTLRPPRAPTVTAGDAVLTLRVIPHGAPDDATTVEASLTVLSFAQRRLTVLQPVQRARRSATFDVVLENLGNSQASCRLALVDEAGRVEGRFDPPSVGVDPGQTASSQVRVRVRRQRWRHGTATLPFQVEAVQDGVAPATATATLLQPPLVSRRTVSRLGALAALVLGLWGAWAWLVSPAIDEAVDDAIDEREVTVTTVPSTAVTTPSTGEPGATSVPPGAGTVPEATLAPGQPFAQRLTVSAPVGQPASQPFVVPPGQQIQITDIILQNPQGDVGTVTLAKNGEVLLTWNLIDVFGDDVKQFITPIVVQPGETMTLDLACASAGDPVSGVCAPAALFSGLSVPVD